MKRSIITTVLVLACSVASTPLAAQDSYSSAIAAFKAGDYPTAKALFTRAYADGRQGPKIYYNLGVVHYKLEEYPEARASFEQIVDDPQWGALAEYNLGLIAEAVGDVSTAQQHYRAAHRRAESEKVRRLAASKLTTRTVTDRGSADGRWYGSFDTAAGYDDNVVLADDQTLAVISDEDDYFAEVTGAAGGYLSGDHRAGWRADVAGYYRFYTELDDFDFGSAFGGLTYDRKVGNWYLGAGGRLGSQFAGGELFTASASSRLQAYRPFTGFGIRISNDAGYIDGASDYEYLTGWRTRVTTELVGRAQMARWRVGYQLELNDRDDLATTTEFFSYSPTRHSVFAEATIYVSDRLSMRGSAAYRASEYDDDDVIVDSGGAVVVGPRDDDRLLGVAGLSYRVGGAWHVFGEYRYADNDADLDVFSYENNQVMLGIRSDF